MINLRSYFILGKRLDTQDHLNKYYLFYIYLHETYLLWPSIKDTKELAIGVKASFLYNLLILILIGLFWIILLVWCLLRKKSLWWFYYWGWWLKEVLKILTLHWEYWTRHGWYLQIKSRGWNAASVGYKEAVDCQVCHWTGMLNNVD